MLKLQLRKHDKVFRSYLWSIIAAMAIGILLGASFALGFHLRGISAERDLVLWKSLIFAPEPEICALCGNGNGFSYHAPVLVNLSTGEVGELRVYDPDPLNRAELAEEQSTGTFSFLHVAGLTGYRDTSLHSSYVTLPQEKAPIVPSHFCFDCRTLLSGTATEGFILADLYNLGSIVTYGIEENKTYTVRDYAISISSQDKLDNLSIHIAGLLFT